MSESRRILKAITILTIVAMLVMILPMSVMAKGKPGKAANDRKPARAAQLLKNGKQTPEPVVELDPAEEAEPEDEQTEGTVPERPAKKSARALFVAARIQWARDNTMPPGHANILYKYLVATKAIDPATITQEPESVTTAIDSLTTGFASIAADSQYYVEGRLSIKAIMATIKSFRLVAEETGVDLDEEAEEADDADEAVEGEDEDPDDTESDDIAEALDPEAET